MVKYSPSSVLHNQTGRRGRAIADRGGGSLASGCRGGGQ